MASKLNPYLNFDGNTRQVMEHYKSVFGGELKMMTFADLGQKDVPFANNIMHAQLESKSGFTLMASDLAPGMPFHVGNNVSISLSGDSADELRGYWKELSQGGSVVVPLEKQMWGDEFGMVTDRFGIHWMVNVGAPR